MNALTKETQAAISPDKSLEMLLEGNKRFTTNSPASRALLDQVSETTGGQYPHAAIVSCIDSRIPTEVVFDQGIGDVFNARIAGNFVNDDILGSLEFACKLAGSKLIMILGHTSCGAVKGACDGAELGNLTQLLDKIQPAIKSVETAPNEERNSSNKKFVNEVAVANVKNTIVQLREQSPVLAEMEKAGELKVVGAMYHVENGQVTLV